MRLINGKELANDNSVVNDDLVEDMIPLGLVLLGAPEKFGKSLLAMQLAYCVSKGLPFLGHKTRKGKVLYIAFEDRQSSVNERYKLFNYDLDEEILFTFPTNTSRYDLKDAIKKVKEEHPDLSAVIVDTYEKTRFNPDSQYTEEYEEGGEIHNFALEQGITILTIHHLTKKINRNDPFNAIYGSRGFRAAADGMLVMISSINGVSTELSVIGKNIPEAKIFIKRNEHLVYEIVEDDVQEEENIELNKII